MVLFWTWVTSPDSQTLPDYELITFANAQTPSQHPIFLHQLTSGPITQNGIPVRGVC